MKSKELRERASEDLRELKSSLKKDLFNHRMRNYTNQLENTSLINAARKDVARIEMILHERVGQEPSKGEET